MKRIASLVAISGNTCIRPWALAYFSIFNNSDRMELKFRCKLQIQIKIILDSKYENADLDTFLKLVKNFDSKKKLSLNKHKNLFDDLLGDWKTDQRICD
jgi:hypothetical protein